MPMLVGIDVNRGYFVEHEKPGSLVSDSPELRSGRNLPMDSGRLQLEHGYYHVAWRDGDAAVRWPEKTSICGSGTRRGRGGCTGRR